MTNKADAVNEAGTEALANAMYRYSFGIIGSGRNGSEGVSLGTGVGVFWKGNNGAAFGIGRKSEHPKLKTMRRDEFTLEEYGKLHTVGRKWNGEADKPTGVWNRTVTYNMILIACNTGMRPAEMKNLRWRDIMPAKDREGREIVVLFVRGKGIRGSWLRLRVSEIIWNASASSPRPRNQRMEFLRTLLVSPQTLSTIR